MNLLEKLKKVHITQTNLMYMMKMKLVKKNNILLSLIENNLKHAFGEEVNELPKNCLFINFVIFF